MATPNAFQIALTNDGYKRRFKAGIAVWSVTTFVIAGVEILAAADGWWWLPHAPWDTISNTVGHLEREWHPTALLVVLLIVVIVAYGIVLPGSSPAPPPGADSAPSALSIFVGTALQTGSVVAGIVLGAITSGAWIDNGYLLEYWIYGGLAGGLILIPMLTPSVKGVQPPFTSLFETIIGIQVLRPLIGVLLLGAFVVLTLHLALYPWPNYEFCKDVRC